MLTAREQQLLQWITENPMISQRELADRAGITRSSVAVHISNLMKKGHIVGKSYIIRQRQYAVVVGAANIDIFGRPKQELVQNDSNPGTVSMTVGGVGRNIAHNLGLLGEDVKLISIFGNDVYADQLKKSCQNLGIDISFSMQVPEAGTSTYLFIADNSGEMQLAISDMEIYEKFTPAYLETKLDIINNAAVCVIDSNIPQKSIEYLAKNVTIPIIVDAVSTAKVMRFKNILNKVHTIKVNALEASMLTEIQVNSMDDVKKAAQKLCDIGIKEVFITLGSRGVYCQTSETAYAFAPMDVKVKNTTGAGDSFTAAIAWAKMHELDLADTAKAGIIASAISIQSYETVNPALSSHCIKNSLSNIKEVTL